MANTITALGSPAASLPTNSITASPTVRPPTTTTTSGTGVLSAGQNAAGGTSAAPVSSYYPTTPTSSDASAGTSTAGSIGTTPTASSSNVNPMASINNGQINPNDSTNTASQLDAITNANSPYIQLAKQQGLLSAGQRGLENSSLASGASEASAVAAAAPLAEQNASTAASGNLQNSQLQTQANEFNAANQNANQQLTAQMATQNSQFNAATQADISKTNAAAQNQMKLQTQQIIGQLNNTALGSQGAAALANIQGKWNALIGSNTAAAGLYSNMLSGISAIYNNKDIAPNKVTDYVNTEVNMFNAAMTVMDSINGGTAPAPVNPTTAGSMTAPAAAAPRTPAAPTGGNK